MVAVDFSERRAYHQAVGAVERYEVEYPVRPRKSDLMVNEVAFVWLPWSVDATGISQPLYRLGGE